MAVYLYIPFNRLRGGTMVSRSVMWNLKEDLPYDDPRRLRYKTDPATAQEVLNFATQNKSAHVIKIASNMISEWYEDAEEPDEGLVMKWDKREDGYFRAHGPPQESRSLLARLNPHSWTLRLRGIRPYDTLYIGGHGSPKSENIGYKTRECRRPVPFVSLLHARESTRGSASTRGALV